MPKTSTLRLVTLILAMFAGAALAHAWLLSPEALLGAGSEASPLVTIVKGGAMASSTETIAIAERASPRVVLADPQPVRGNAAHLCGPRWWWCLRSGTHDVAWRAASVRLHLNDSTYRFVAAADTSSIAFDHVWARPTQGAGSTGAVYFAVTNNGAPDALIGASTPIAAKAEVHETTNDNGIMKMRPVPSIALAPGKPVTFKPGGYHVMLTGLKDPLKVGDGFPLTLTFAHAQPVTVMVKVETAGGAGMGGSMPGMPGMH